ncbi:MAG TPA: hypothetical protein VN038_01580 [Dyadobacter sp.]|nr:hypothetical protein [Dyadobacter sp.]
MIIGDKNVFHIVGKYAGSSQLGAKYHFYCGNEKLTLLPWFACVAYCFRNGTFFTFCQTSLRFINPSFPMRVRKLVNSLQNILYLALLLAPAGVHVQAAQAAVTITPRTRVIIDDELSGDPDCLFQLAHALPNFFGKCGYWAIVG